MVVSHRRKSVKGSDSGKHIFGVLNALFREFIGYLSLTWKRHAFALALLLVAAVIAM